MRTIVYLILSLSLLVSCDLYITSGDTGEIRSSSGQLQAKGEWIYTKSKKMDMYDHYQKWENSYTEFYKDGSVKSTYRSVHKRATYGRPCKELISHYISYHPNGIKSFEQKDICDCSKSIITYYNKAGSVIEKKVIKRKTKQVKKQKEEKKK
ncbi:hypothetical protein [Parvicella tangerina]|uniref:Lipoprotein n=1 Tax=Parvicella tangerina TaxID=2829795 RepID=A0A916N8F1_9FLAO|nr:hypothetical protein [Parvicella tangerina]CAG5076875.1 hypothetical protein CRYO30217_00229 [Parvicella tangerina]